MIKLLKLLGFKIASRDDFWLLQFQNEMLQTAVETLRYQCDNLTMENDQLKKKLQDYDKRDENALQKLMEEMDILALEYMEPVGEA